MMGKTHLYFVGKSVNWNIDSGHNFIVCASKASKTFFRYTHTHLCIKIFFTNIFMSVKKMQFVEISSSRLIK